MSKHWLVVGFWRVWPEQAQLVWGGAGVDVQQCTSVDGDDGVDGVDGDDGDDGDDVTD